MANPNPPRIAAKPAWKKPHLHSEKPRAYVRGPVAKHRLSGTPAQIEHPTAGRAPKK